MHTKQIMNEEQIKALPGWQEQRAARWQNIAIYDERLKQIHDLDHPTIIKKETLPPLKFYDKFVDGLLIALFIPVAFVSILGLAIGGVISKMIKRLRR